MAPNRSEYLARLQRGFAFFAVIVVVLWIFKGRGATEQQRIMMIAGGSFAIAGVVILGLLRMKNKR